MTIQRGWGLDVGSGGEESDYPCARALPTLVSQEELGSVLSFRVGKALLSVDKPGEEPGSMEGALFHPAAVRTPRKPTCNVAAQREQVSSSIHQCPC